MQCAKHASGEHGNQRIGPCRNKGPCWSIAGCPICGLTADNRACVAVIHIKSPNECHVGCDYQRREDKAGAEEKFCDAPQCYSLFSANAELCDADQSAKPINRWRSRRSHERLVSPESHLRHISIFLRKSFDRLDPHTC